MPIYTEKGSATEPQPENGRGILIAHISNDLGAWGKGFVLAVNKVSMAGKVAYQAWAKDHNKSIPRGLVQLVELKPNVFVANMIAQRGLDKSNDPCLVDYKALEKCLKIAFKRAIQLNCDVHIPAGIGSGLAGGNRDIIHDLIRDVAAVVEEEETCCNSQECCGGSGPDLNITLWEFADTSSDSFVATTTPPLTTGSPGTSMASQSVPDSILGNPTENDL